jgi:uncharacterized repeat protein (TIGR01451 family)
VDLDNDGNIDVAATSPVDNKVVWYRNLGSGQFSAELVISETAEGASAIIGTDIDGDGWTDLVVTCPGGNRLEWYRNLGNGTFSSGLSVIDQLDGADHPAVGDLNGDGYLDVVVTSSVDSLIVWYPNAGNGSFGTQQVLSGEAVNVVSLFVNDLDGDGSPDIIYGNYAGEIYWQQNAGGGNFTTQLTIANVGATCRSIHPKDMDGNGTLDVLAISATANVAVWFRNEGTGTFGVADTITSTLINGAYITAGDINNDGIPDALLSDNFADRLSHCVNDGAGNFSPAALIAASETPGVKQAICLDIDGDGLDDVLTVSNENQRVAWYRNEGSGNFGSQQIVWQGPLPTSVLPSNIFIHPVDVDGDGDPDLVSIHGSSSVRLALNDGSGQFGAQVVIASVTLLQSISSGDVDNDGDMDLLINNVSLLPGGPQVARNNGAGQFTFPSVTVLNDIAVSMFADIDGDTDLDVIIGMGGQFTRYLNNGNGQFGTGLSFGSGVGSSQCVAWGDMNGDGIEDLVSGSFMNDWVAWFPNLGNGSFGAPVLIAVVDRPRSIAVGDLDGDGDQDVVSTSWAPSGPIAYHLNDGTGAFGPGLTMSTEPYGTFSVDLSDLTGNGFLDVVISANLDNRVAWFENLFGAAFRMEGTVYNDLDEDGNPNAGEPGFPWCPMTTSPFSTVSYTGPDGTYSIPADSGNYQVSIAYLNPLWQVSTDPPYQATTLSPSSPVATGLDLGVVPVVDTSYIVPSLAVMPGVCGAVVDQFLTFSNQGTRVEQGRIILDLGSPFNFLNATPPPSLVSGGTYEWDFAGLACGESRLISMRVIRPLALFLGQDVSSYVTVQCQDLNGIDTDIFTYDWSEQVLCSYDPNDKQVEPTGLGELGIVDIGTPYLDYTIRFQNTGNAPAQDVVLKDLLDDALIPGSMTVLGYSHTPTRIFIDTNNDLTVEFNGIQLPDSGSDVGGSQGFFKFRMRVAPGITHATTVANTGRIFFDLNDPIITNTVTNTFVDCGLHTAGITDLGEGLLQASPGESYQWYLNGEAIPGAEDVQLQTTVSGQYSVVTENEFYCTAESEPYFSGTTQVGQFIAWTMELVPNPVDRTPILRTDRILTERDVVEVLDGHGRLVHSTTGNGGRSIAFNASDWAPGIFILRIIGSSGETGTMRFVVP